MRRWEGWSWRQPENENHHAQRQELPQTVTCLSTSHHGPLAADTVLCKFGGKPPIHRNGLSVNSRKDGGGQLCQISSGGQAHPTPTGRQLPPGTERKGRKC